MSDKTAVERATEKINAAEALAKWRAKKGLSVGEIARRLEVTEATVYNWLNGTTLPTGTPLSNLLQLLKS